MNLPRGFTMSMRSALLLSMLLVSFGVTAVSLLAVRTSLRTRIRQDLRQDLAHSLLTFENLEQQRQQTLIHETALLADIPSLKALMTTSDARTIADGGTEFWRVSGGDFFALTDRSGRALALYHHGGSADQPMNQQDAAAQLQAQIEDKSATLAPNEQRLNYIFAGELYEIAIQPLYFGNATDGTLLGYVALGYVLDDRVARHVSNAADADVVFCANGAVASSTLDPELQQQFLTLGSRMMIHPENSADLRLGTERFLAASVPLTSYGAPSVQLVVLKSFDKASEVLDRLNRLIAALGALALLAGGGFAVYLSGTITRPLDTIVAGAHALGVGDFNYQLAQGGVRELRELSDAFDHMRRKLQEGQQELIEAERLATIGRMASSISHDLRHYLSAVYANAEFLGGTDAAPEERAELLGEIRLAVEGMTDMIDSLLIFSRTGHVLNPTCESLGYVAERAAALVRAHPDASGVILKVLPAVASAEVWMDAKKIERALYNLLLNACQATAAAARIDKDNPEVSLSIHHEDEWEMVRIRDNGDGVAERIRATLFEPFVSSGKESGIGLGLTLTSRIAQEHGGTVELLASRPGLTIFQFRISRSMPRFTDVSAVQKTILAEE